ncbi:MAG: efflux RND transporter periplasmic adaptor subunit [Planctomycetota bacterium]|jgi:RND family efflux transporter MFP subunit|nr:efflux RND transporter periplasmic adaptor subunit [Planctomycetota bacterium]
MRKFFVLLTLAAFAMYVGWRYWTIEGNVEAGRGDAANQVVAVETATIQRADLRDITVFTGSVRAEERYDAAPKISGIIRAINFDVGDTVRRGDILAVLDDDEYVLDVERAEASLKVSQAVAVDAESQLTIAARDFARAENLRRESVISPQEFDRYDAALKAQEAKRDTARAEVRLAEAALKTARVRLGYTRVTADWSGGQETRVIGRRFMDAGALATANTPILSVLDISVVRAVIAVSEKRYPGIVPDGEARVFTDAFPNRVFEGRIARIPQELDTLTREAEVEVRIENRDYILKPGMFIRANIEFARNPDAVAAPLEAVVRRDDGSRGVFLVDEERSSVSFRPVTEGIVDRGLVELVGGEDMDGREVVALGQHLLKDGMTIRVSGGAQAAIAGRNP